MALVAQDLSSAGTLRAAQVWKDRCLLANGSILSDAQLWSAEHLNALRDAFVNNPIEGKEPFYTKLARQLGDQSDEVKKLAAECLWILVIFVHKNEFRASARRDRIADLWKLTGEGLPQSEYASPESMSGIGWPGTAFLTCIPNEFQFVIEAMLAWKQLPIAEQQTLASDPWQFCTWLTGQNHGNRRIFRQMLLYLLFPESFERVCSQKQRRKIHEVFGQRYRDTGLFANTPPTLCQLDQSLLEIRKLAEREFGTQDLDFYHEPLKSLWDKKPEKQATDAQPSKSERAVWIEKPLVEGRPDREHGNDALGASLWSPQLSNAGTDIYSNMRRVKPGDIVFHLTDNKGITAVSIAASEADDQFVCLENTVWAGQPGYRVALRDSRAIEPPLRRESFLATEPFAALLRQVAMPGAGVFFNKKLELNQGSYLTAASEKLLTILNAAYRLQSGKSLPYCEAMTAPEPASEIEAMMVDLSNLFMDEEEIEDLLSLWRAKKNIILQGPPSVGKSFASRKLAFGLGNLTPVEYLARLETWPTPIGVGQAGS
ncbi:MAG: hypothetical protein AB7G25_02665 [Sphingomonadaceae bacterium]